MEITGSLGDRSEIGIGNAFTANKNLSISPYFSFIANLGSLNMRAGFHHLFEWGNCPLFMMVGRAEEKPVVVDGEVKVQKQLHIRWTYDERIDDGLSSNYGMTTFRETLEDPASVFGELPALDKPLKSAVA